MPNYLQPNPKLLSIGAVVAKLFFGKWECLSLPSTTRLRVLGCWLPQVWTGYFADLKVSNVGLWCLTQRIRFGGGGHRWSHTLLLTPPAMFCSQHSLKDLTGGGSEKYRWLAPCWSSKLCGLVLGWCQPAVIPHHELSKCLMALLQHLVRLPVALSCLGLGPQLASICLKGEVCVCFVW